MIALYRGRSWLSRAIRWRTWSVYSHAAWIDDDDGSLYEAWYPQGVRHLPDINVGHTPGTVVDLFGVVLTPEQKNGLRKWLTSQLGKPYDLWAILGFIWRLDIQDDSKWVCSELLYQGLLENGVELLASDTPASRVSPGVFALSPFLSKKATVVTV